MKEQEAYTFMKNLTDDTILTERMDQGLAVLSTQIKVSCYSGSCHILGCKGDVVETVASLLVRQWVDRGVYHMYDTPRYLMEKATQDLVEEGGLPATSNFVHVCSSCERDPCYLHEYLFFIGQIARTLHRRGKSRSQIRVKIIKFLSYRLGVHGLFGQGGEEIPGCIQGAVDEVFPAAREPTGRLV